MKAVSKETPRKGPYRMVNIAACAAAALVASVFLASCGGGGSSHGGGSNNDDKPGPTVKLNTFQNAELVVGQADFVGSDENQNGSPGANTLNRPAGSVFSEGVFLIADRYNNRLLGFNTLPDINNAHADFVLGQADFTSNGDGAARNKLYYPNDIAIANGKVAVADNYNNRVLLYSDVPGSGSALPDVVVGQSDFTSGNRGCAQDEVAGLRGVEITEDGKLIATDPDNSRILVWNSLPTQNGQGADLVLGQGDFTHCQENDDDQDGVADATPTARTLLNPHGVWSDGNRLVVTDRSNNRVLIWNSFPTANFQPADIVLGQGDFTHSERNDDDQDRSADSEPTNRTFNLPEGVDSNGVQLAIADQINHRVLVWNRFPTSSFEPADLVLGQGDFNRDWYNDDDQVGANDGAPTARTLKSPSAVQFSEEGLLVTDNKNNRVLFYRSQ